jgi:Tectonin domain
MTVNECGSRLPGSRTASVAALLLSAGLSAVYGQSGVWTKMPGRGNFLAASKAGVWAYDAGSKAVYKWNEPAGTWAATALGDCHPITADDRGNVWGVSGGKVLVLATGAGAPTDTGAAGVVWASVDPATSTLYALDTNKFVWQRTTASSTWQKFTAVPGTVNAKQIIANPGGGIWMTAGFSPGAWQCTSANCTPSPIGGLHTATVADLVRTSGGWFAIYGKLLRSSFGGSIPLGSAAADMMNAEHLAFENGASGARLWMMTELGYIWRVQIPPATQIAQEYTTAANALKTAMGKITDAGSAQINAPDVDTLLGPYLLAKRNAHFWMLLEANSQSDVSAAASAVKAAEDGLEAARKSLLTGPYSASVAPYFTNLRAEYRPLAE